MPPRRKSSEQSSPKKSLVPQKVPADVEECTSSKQAEESGSSLVHKNAASKTVVSDAGALSDGIMEMDSTPSSSTNQMAWGTGPKSDVMDFSSDIPKDVTDNLDLLIMRLQELESLIQRWVTVPDAERQAHFSDTLEEERMSLWVMNALVTLGEVYCRLNGMDLEKEGINEKKTLLSRYAAKFEQFDKRARTASRVEAGPASRLDMEATKRFLRPALTKDGEIALINEPKDRNEST